MANTKKKQRAWLKMWQIFSGNLATMVYNVEINKIVNKFL